jgi:hypothetical protein
MTTALDALLSARVHETGHALRRTTLRHTHLNDEPFAICMWRLGGERFRAAAIAWGPISSPPKIAVAGDPRNRDLYFNALLAFARDLCTGLDTATAKRERSDNQWDDNTPVHSLQLVVPNRATVTALGLLGRYLAYLTDRGGAAPDPALVLAGKHVRFYTKHARVPGQSLIVPLDRLVADHWATLQSPLETANLAALDAQIEPQRGVHAFVAANQVERLITVGPEPTEAVDRRTSTLLDEFNEKRAGSTDPRVVRKHIRPLQEHYRSLIDPVWELMQRTLAREQELPPAPTVERRHREDRRELRWHLEWMEQGGRYRTRDTARMAAMKLRRLEQAQELYEAERALDDPACMVPYLLDGEAIEGTVAFIDRDRTEQGPKKLVNRPLIRVESVDSVVMPYGKHLWWTATADDQPWRVHAIAPQGNGCTVELVLEAPATDKRMPSQGATVTFSVLKTKKPIPPYKMPTTPPWTHTPPAEPPVEPIDLGDAESVTPASGARQIDGEVVE